MSDGYRRSDQRLSEVLVAHLRRGLAAKNFARLEAIGELMIDLEITEGLVLVLCIWEEEVIPYLELFGHIELGLRVLQSLQEKKDRADLRDAEARIVAGTSQADLDTSPQPKLGEQEGLDMRVSPPLPGSPEHDRLHIDG